MRGTATLLTAIGLATAALAESSGPPLAIERPVVENHFGTETVDPYRYLEDVRQPHVMQWLQGQAAYARSTLAALSGRQMLLDRLTALFEHGGDRLRDIVQRPGGRLFYLKRGAKDNQFKLYTRRGGAESERLLVDPERMEAASGIPYAVNYFVPSWDGRYLAFGMSAGGSENAALYLLDVASGRQIGAPISRATGWGLTPVTWTPDSRAVVFNRLRRPDATMPVEDTYKDSTVYELAAGADESSARPIFSAALLPGLRLQHLDYASMLFNPRSHWVIATINDTTDQQYKIFVLPAAELDNPGAAWRQVADTSDGVRNVALRGDELYMLTHAGAKRFRIVRLNLKGGQFKDSVTILPEQSGVLTGLTAASEALYATVRDAWNVSILRVPYSNGKIEPVLLPVTGTASLINDDAQTRRGVLAVAESWTKSPRVYAWNPKTRAARDLRLRLPGAFEQMNNVEVKNVLISSYDSVQIPLTILSKRGMKLNGANPTILYGYGSYGLTTDPAFDLGLFAWLERGGIYAIAGVRGGGEFGEDWRVAGAKSNKPNTWKDGIACAEYLIRQRFTSHSFLAAMGGSAGGIFVGRVITSRPELFRAAVIRVGLTDTLRFEFTSNGATNISEIGSVSDPDGFRDLLEMSTYDHIKDGISYPAVLLAHGINDPRVDIWESLKTTARLQHATASGRPILLRVEDQAGHGIGSTRQQRLAETADIYSFLWWQMGDPAFQPAR